MALAMGLGMGKRSTKIIAGLILAGMVVVGLMVHHTVTSGARVATEDVGGLDGLDEDHMQWEEWEEDGGSDARPGRGRGSKEYSTVLSGTDGFWVVDNVWVKDRVVCESGGVFGFGLGGQGVAFDGGRGLRVVVRGLRWPLVIRRSSFVGRQSSRSEVVSLAFER